MKLFATTNKGIEKYCRDELKEKLGIKDKDIKTEDSVVMFETEIKETETKNFSRLFELYYTSQSASRIAIFIDSFEFEDEEDIINKIKKISLKKEIQELLEKDIPFVARVFKQNIEDKNKKSTNEIQAIELEPQIGEIFLEKTKAKVDLHNPNIVVLGFVSGSTFYLGLDLAGFDSSKRQHMLYHHKEALKPTLAYAMLREAGIKMGGKNEKVVIFDPFCGMGTIPIEAAIMLSGMPVNYYNKGKFLFEKHPAFSKTNFEKLFSVIDSKIKENLKARIVAYDKQFGYVSSAQKNAKIAAINKLIDFGRMDTEWLDTKFDKETVDYVVTNPPFSTKQNERETSKVYKTFFCEMEFMLKKEGIIVLSTETPEIITKFAEEYKFKLKNKFEAWQGQKKMQIISFVK